MTHFAMTHCVIRVTLPYHLQALAKVGAEVPLEVDKPATIGAVIDSLERKYPMLQGTIRDHVTKKRRPMVRYFVCEKDVSHESPETMLPEAVLSGSEPFMIWGAIAGG
jgi:sulfur-carrier protein